MSLNMAIAHGKEKRKAYRGCKAVDPYCRNHGRCKYCENNRLSKALREKIRTDSILADYYRNGGFLE